MTPDLDHIMTHTAFKTKERACAALQTLQWLKDGAPGHHPKIEGELIFDMDCVVDPYYCGTACCIAGSMMIFEKGKIDHSVTIGDTFGWVDPQLEDLFFGYGAAAEHPVNPKTAHKVLLHYLQTGQTDWSLA